MNQPLPMHTALEVFLRGFSTTRSFIKPYEVSQLSERIWLMADPPAANHGDARKSEVIAYGATPEEIQETLRQREIGRYMLCVLLDEGEKPDATSAVYKSLGYRLIGREPLFVLDTAQRIRFETFPVRRVTTAADANAVAKAARTRQIFPQHLTEGDSVCRLYTAFDEDRPVGWVRSIRTQPDCAWVSNLFVHPDLRRKGIGRTLMTAMLDDDAKYGVEWSVLLASLTGAMLYPHLGYEQRGLLMLFYPRKTS